MNLAEPVRIEGAAGWLTLDGYRPEYARQVRQLAAVGFEPDGIAEFFEVDRATLDGWRARHADFADALAGGMAFADLEVTAALYRAAAGHERPATHVTSRRGRTAVTPYTVHVPPDVRASMYWLERRCPEQWSARPEVRADGEVLLRLVVG